MSRVISRRTLLLMFLDMGIIYISFVLAQFLYLKHLDFIGYLPSFGVICFSYLLAFHIFDYYSPFRHFKSSDVMAEVMLIVLTSSCFMVGVFFFYPDLRIVQSVLLSSNLFIYAGIVLIRLIYNDIFGSTTVQLRTLIVGDGPWLKEIDHLIHNTVHAGLKVIGVAMPKSEGIIEASSSMQVLGTLDEINSIIDHKQISCVVLAMEEKTRDLENEIIAKLYEKNVRIFSSLRLYEQMTGQIPFHFFRGGHLLGIAEQITDRFYLTFKRAFDIVTAICIGLVFLPIIVICMIVLAFEFKSLRKVIFFQERIGKNGKPFIIYKLRTMMDMQSGEKIVTKAGQWIRKYRIDEALQVINVLKGDMSFIGPRPETSYFIAYCRSNIPYYNVVFSVRPGLTGWAQIRFSHTTKLEDYKIKFCFDLYYLKYCSMTLDILIIFETIKVILFGRGK